MPVDPYLPSQLWQVVESSPGEQSLCSENDEKINLNLVLIVIF